MHGESFSSKKNASEGGTKISLGGVGYLFSLPESTNKQKGRSLGSWGGLRGRFFLLRQSKEEKIISKNMRKKVDK